MKVTNETSDQKQVKICLYKTGDKVQWVPVGAGVFVVKKGDSVTWTPPAGEELDAYHLKAFHPSFIDGFLCDATVGLNESVAIRGGGGKYSVDKL
jgi:hypothetical protein